MAEPLRIDVPANLGGERLDRVLEALIYGRTRAQLQKLVRRGRVKLDGKRVTRSNGRVTAGAKLLVHLEDPSEPPPAPEVPVIFVDDDLLVVDKPAGLVTHATERIPNGTLADILDERFGPLPTTRGPERPGVVHRLDRDTSGVIVLGRSERAMEHLRDQFRRRTVMKTYLACVRGRPPGEEWDVDRPTGPAGDGSDRQVVDPVQDGKSARTSFRVLERGRATWIECRPETGRRHQIRVHLLASGLEIVGEPLYRVSALGRPGPELPRPGRMALHASELELDHPRNGERVRFRAELRPELESLRNWARG